jgi:hypothetical protein
VRYREKDPFTRYFCKALPNVIRAFRRVRRVTGVQK